MGRRLLIALVVAGLPACGGIGVREVKRPAIFADWRASISLPTRRRHGPFRRCAYYDLDHVYDHNPDDAIHQLHAIAVADPQPDTLFALAELSYIRGEALAKKHPDDAVRQYVRCCAYAQHYLLASSVDSSKRRTAGRRRRTAAAMHPHYCQLSVARCLPLR